MNKESETLRIPCKKKILPKMLADAAGISALQLIFLLLVLGSAGYIGVSIGGIYYRYYDLENEMKGITEAAEIEPEEKIKTWAIHRIKLAKVPANIDRLIVSKNEDEVHIQLPYTETFTIEFNGKKYYSKSFNFKIDVNRRF